VSKSSLRVSRPLGEWQRRRLGPRDSPFLLRNPLPTRERRKVVTSFGGKRQMMRLNGIAGSHCALLCLMTPNLQGSSNLRFRLFSTS
jgi:hypothetical protein